MPGQLDEISVAIGELQAGQRTAEHAREELKASITALNANLASLTLAMATATATIQRVEPQVAEWVEKSKKAQWIGLGALGGGAVAGGAIGAKVMAVLGLLAGK